MSVPAWFCVVSSRWLGSRRLRQVLVAYIVYVCHRCCYNVVVFSELGTQKCIYQSCTLRLLYIYVCSYLRWFSNDMTWHGGSHWPYYVKGQSSRSWVGNIHRRENIFGCACALPGLTKADLNLKLQISYNRVYFLCLSSSLRYSGRSVRPRVSSSLL